MHIFVLYTKCKAKYCTVQSLLSPFTGNSSLGERKKYQIQSTDGVPGKLDNTALYCGYVSQTYGTVICNCKT